MKGSSSQLHFPLEALWIWGADKRKERTVIIPFGEGSGTPFQYSCLENPMDGGAWKAAVHGVAEGWTRLSDFTFTSHLNALEKEMATHSSVLAWRIPGMGEPGGLPSMGLHRVGHNWSDLAAAAAAATAAALSHYWRAQTVKSLPTMREAQVRFLGGEEPLEKEMATHSSILVWEIPWTEEPDGLQSMGSRRVWHNLVTSTLTFYWWGAGRKGTCPRSSVV